MKVTKELLKSGISIQSTITDIVQEIAQLFEEVKSIVAATTNEA